MIIGLTGGIGSGKSAAADMFAALGATVVDADQVAHELTAPKGAAIPQLTELFGVSILTEAGGLNRAAMRELAFNDPSARAKLESLLHPMIRGICDERCRSAPPPYALLVVPLLIESGTYRQRVQRVVVVDCPETLQIERVMARSGLAREEVERIMAAQISRAARNAAADDIIDNSGDRAALAKQVEALHARYVKMAGFD